VHVNGSESEVLLTIETGPLPFTIQYNTFRYQPFLLITSDYSHIPLKSQKIQKYTPSQFCKCC